MFVDKINNRIKPCVTLRYLVKDKSQIKTSVDIILIQK